MKSLLRTAFLLVMMIVTAFAASTSPAETYSAPAPPPIPSDVKGKEGVKVYLVSVAEQCLAAAKDLKAAADEYDKLVQDSGSPAAAAEKSPDKVVALLHRLRDAYKRMDSFGYEYIEGIVAGVPSLTHYDTELDAGVPLKGANPDDNIATVHIDADGVHLDKDGSLNNFLVEPTVFGTNPRFVAATVKLPGFDKPVGLPKPRLIVALGAYASEAYARLLKDSKAWQPTDKDCFQALANMTPTLADYFEEWKESRVHGAAMGGRFVAVSRVSDMRGIMSSTRLTWLGLEPLVRTKDKALADKLTQGYNQVLEFIDTTDAREHAKSFNVETIDALGSQAKEKTDKMTVQIGEAAALCGVEITTK